MKEWYLRGPVYFTLVGKQVLTNGTTVQWLRLAPFLLALSGGVLVIRRRGRLTPETTCNLTAIGLLNQHLEGRITNIPHTSHHQLFTPTHTHRGIYIHTHTYPCTCLPKTHKPRSSQGHGSTSGARRHLRAGERRAALLVPAASLWVQALGLK